MPKVEKDVTTPVAPDRVRAALIDFSPRRPEIWPGITPSQYKVYDVGATSADVREGTRGLWAREHYDWSDPQTVKWTVQESNFSSVGSASDRGPSCSTIRAIFTGGRRTHA